MSRDALMDLLKHERLEAFDRSIDVHISRIRAAIEDDAEEAAPRHHGARRRLCLRQGAGLRADMRRLYQKIYLTIIASLLLVVLVAGGVWRFGAERLAGEPGVRDGRASSRPRRCRRPTRRAPCSSEAIDALAERLGTDLALFDSDRRLIALPGGRCRRRRRSDERRLGLRAGRAGLELSACPTGAGSWRARRRATAIRCCGCLAVSRRHRARGRGLRLSGGARADAPAGTAADRRRDARRGRSVGARQRSRAATRWRGLPRASTAPPRASRNWSARIGCCSRTPRTNCARRSRAFGSASSCSSSRHDPKYKAELERDIAELDAADRRDPAGEPARCDAARCRRREDGRSAGARGRGMRALRRLHPRRAIR